MCIRDSTYSAQFGFNYTGLTGGGLNGKTDFPSYNGSLLTNITIFRNHSTGSGLYLASEFDFGNGFDFNEGSKGPKTTLGSLQNPTSSFQGPDPHLSNLSLAWVGAGGKLLLMAGQLDTTNYMDHNACLLYTSHHLWWSGFRVESERVRSPDFIYLWHGLRQIPCRG